ncbi:MAG TPA: histone deacetylase, partial [Candidatus Dormibacteraeota bacterium]|nr:histone deacetylase [Candidatus Dormibacteraeota bacterium]
GRDTERGAGAGVGATLNLPLPAGTDGDRWLRALDEAAIGAIAGHRPDVILVSAGYDAHDADPLAGLRLATETYGSVAARVVEMARSTGGAGSVWFLEGGYDLEAMPASIAATLRVLAADTAG